MGDLIGIDDLRKMFAEKTSIEEWKAFSEQQNSIIDKYQRELTILKNKNYQLENLLLNKFSAPLTPEENICIQQIDRLEKLSNERQLTLEEVKRLDLLIKNLKLIREESTVIVQNRTPDNIEEADLVAIARTKTTEDSDSGAS